MTLRVEPAAGEALCWATDSVARHHYLRKPPDARSRPFCHAVTLAGELVGCLWWGRPEASCCYRGELTYGSREDVAAGRAEYDRWEVLNLSRVWFSPDVQPGGRLHGPAWLPGFHDRHTPRRSALASTVILVGLHVVGLDYLVAHPPVWVEQPYQIKAVLSYCDPALHKGTVYRAAGFRLARTNDAGLQTWFYDGVLPLLSRHDLQVREASEACPRARRLRRAARLPLFDGGCC